MTVKKKPAKLILGGDGENVGFIHNPEAKNKTTGQFTLCGTLSRYDYSLGGDAIVREADEDSLFFTEIARQYGQQEDGHTIELLDNYRQTVSNFYMTHYVPCPFTDPNFMDDITNVISTPLKIYQLQAVAHFRKLVLEKFQEPGEVFRQRAWDSVPKDKPKVIGKYDASEQGQGKTLNSLASVLSVGCRRILVITLSSVTGKVNNGKCKMGWAAEINKHTTAKMVPVILSGRGKTAETRKTLYDAISIMPYAICVTSYETLRNDIQFFMDMEWDAVIMDEAIKLMTPSSRLVSAALKFLDPTRPGTPPIRIALCGTPVTKSAADLYAQFVALGIIAPDPLDETQKRGSGKKRQRRNAWDYNEWQWSLRRWRATFSYKQTIMIGMRPVTRYVGINNAERLSKIVAHNWFRVGKNYAAMPPKLSKVVRVPIDPEEYKLYEKLENDGDLFDDAAIKLIREAGIKTDDDDEEIETVELNDESLRNLLESKLHNVDEADEESDTIQDRQFDGDFAASVAKAARKDDVENVIDKIRMISTATKNALIRLQRFCGGFAYQFNTQKQGNELLFMQKSKAMWLYNYMNTERYAVAPCGTRYKKFILWCYYNAEVDLLCQLCEHQGIKYAKVTGAVDTDTLSDVQEDFQNGDIQVIVAQIRRMYAGANLQACDTHIYYSQPWSPMVRAQSEDRSHRTGRDYPVEYITLELCGPMLPGYTDEKQCRNLIDYHINVNIIERKMAVLRALSVDTVAHAIEKDQKEALDHQLAILQQTMAEFGFSIDAGIFSPKFDDVVIDASEDADVVIEKEEDHVINSEDINALANEDEIITDDDED